MFASWLIVKAGLNACFAKWGKKRISHVNSASLIHMSLEPNVRKSKYWGRLAWSCNTERERKLPQVDINAMESLLKVCKRRTLLVLKAGSSDVDIFCNCILATMLHVRDNRLPRQSHGGCKFCHGSLSSRALKQFSSAGEVEPFYAIL